MKVKHTKTIERFWILDGFEWENDDNAVVDNKYERKSVNCFQIECVTIKIILCILFLPVPPSSRAVLPCIFLSVSLSTFLVPYTTRQAQREKDANQLKQNGL